jgi:hypothetical protein
MRNVEEKKNIAATSKLRIVLLYHIFSSRAALKRSGRGATMRGVFSRFAMNDGGSAGG